MSIRPKWLRDFASIIFSFYYIIYAQEADEKVLAYFQPMSFWEKKFIAPMMILASQVPRGSDGRDAPYDMGKNHQSIRQYSAI
jgi:hypothetical protein